MGRREIGGSWQRRIDGRQPDPEHSNGHKQGQRNKGHTPEEVEEQVGMHLCYSMLVSRKKRGIGRGEVVVAKKVGDEER